MRLTAPGTKADHREEDRQRRRSRASERRSTIPLTQAPAGRAPRRAHRARRRRRRREEHRQQPPDLHASSSAPSGGRPPAGQPPARRRRMLRAAWTSSPSTVGIVALAALALALAAARRWRRAARARCGALRADQRVVLGDGERDLVAHAADMQRQFASLHDYVVDVADAPEGRLDAAERRLDGAIAHRAIVRYDAYNEMSGRQSTSIALLDAAALGDRAVLHPPPRPGAALRQAGRRGPAPCRSPPRRSEALRAALARRGPGRGASAGRAATLMRVGYLGPAGDLHARRRCSPARRRAGARARPAADDPRHGRRAVARGDVDRRARPDRELARGLGQRGRSTRSSTTRRRCGSSARRVLPSATALIARAGRRARRRRARRSRIRRRSRSARASCARAARAQAPCPRRSTAEAVREAIARRRRRRARSATPLAAELYGGTVLREGVEDDHDNVTRFVWLARRARPATTPGDAAAASGRRSVVFWGDGDGDAGLARALPGGVRAARRQPHAGSSRGRAKRRLGHYMFLVDCSDGPTSRPAGDAIGGLGAHCERGAACSGSYPAARACLSGADGGG